MDASHFVAIFRERRALCRAIAELAGEQRRGLGNSDYSLVIETLQQKQRLVDELARASREQGLVWTSWTSQRERLGTDVRNECEQLLAEIEDLMAALLREEQADVQLLTTRLNATRRELAVINQGVQVREAYGSSTAAASSTGLVVDM